MKKSSAPDLPATLSTTLGLKVGQFLKVNGRMYLISQVVDARRVLLKDVRPSKQAAVAKRMQA